MAAGAGIAWIWRLQPKAENRLRNSCRPGNPPKAPRFRSWGKSAGRRSSPIWRRSLPHSKIKKSSPNPSIHDTDPITMNDVIIIGGSFPGLAGALHWGLVWSGPQSHNYVRLFHDWTDTLTVFAAGHDIPRDIRADLVRRNIPVVDGRIIEIAHRGGHNATVKLDTGPNVAVDILFAHPRTKPSASLHESLGLATANTPLGIVLKVDERRETSMPGIYAAGDLVTPLLPSATFT